MRWNEVERAYKERLAQTNERFLDEIRAVHQRMADKSIQSALSQYDDLIDEIFGQSGDEPVQEDDAVSATDRQIDALDKREAALKVRKKQQQIQKKQAEIAKIQGEK